MAPEMGLGKPDVDWRADIYALGCVGYWLLTGKPVFDAGRLADADHHGPHPEAAAALVSARTKAAIPAELDFILLQCLAKDPNERPQTMQDLAESLAARSRSRIPGRRSAPGAGGSTKETAVQPRPSRLGFRAARSLHRRHLPTAPDLPARRSDDSLPSETANRLS